MSPVIIQLNKNRLTLNPKSCIDSFDSYESSSRKDDNVQERSIKKSSICIPKIGENNDVLSVDVYLVFSFVD